MLNIFLCHNYINLRCARSIIGSDNSKKNIIFYNPRRINLDLIVRGDFIYIPINRIVSIIFFFFSRLLRMEIYAPHFKFNKLFFNKCEKINLICDGLDFYRENPNNLTEKDMEKVKYLYAFEGQKYFPGWVSKLQLRTVKEKWIEKKVEDCMIISGKLSNIKNIYIESPALKKNSFSNDDLIIAHPDKTKRRLDGKNLCVANDLGATLENILINSENIEIHIGESFVIKYLIDHLNEKKNIFVYINYENAMQLRSLIREIIESNVNFSYV